MTKPTKLSLSRRTFLRGAAAGVGVAVGLPALEIMLNGNATAYADGTSLPSRFGVWFFGNGIRRAHWIPDGEGAGWTPRAELQPLVDAGLHDWINVLTGFEIKTATHPHHSGMSGIMTGARYHQNGTTRDTIVSTFAYPSVDQVAAAAFEGRTRLRSLEVGITRFRGTDEGTSFQHLSHNGPNNVNPSEYSPSNLFARLFGTAPEPQIAAARRSVLDVVRGQVRRLQPTLGSNDRRRLEQHLDSIRTLESGLAAGAAACMVPVNPGDFPDVEGREQIEQQNRAMSDLMALALACDMTRAFSMFFSTAGSGVIVWPAGAGNSLHQMCHDEPGDQPTVHATVVFTMQQLAYFLTKLRDTPEADTNVLDRSSILITTELSEGNVHSNDDFPILTAGRACGRLRTGIHYRSPSRENTSKALLTTLRASGVPLPAGFGYEAGHVDDGVSAIEV